MRTLNHAYTLQGWIKGVNSDILDPENDMGLDSHNDENNPNRYFAKDAMGFSLGYFEGDYTAIDAMGVFTFSGSFMRS